ncbi:hypothetical protein D3C87_587870 [compost metagenome]
MNIFFIAYLVIAALVAFVLAGMFDNKMSLARWYKAMPLAMFWGPLALFALWHLGKHYAKKLGKNTDFKLD